MSVPEAPHPQEAKCWLYRFRDSSYWYGPVTETTMGQIKEADREDLFVWQELDWDDIN